MSARTGWEAPHAPRTYLERLPKSLRDELGRAGRRNGVRLAPPSMQVQERIAREALTCGVRAGGQQLAYVVRRLRHAVGIGEYPSPPSMRAADLEYIDAKVNGIIARLSDQRTPA